LLALLHRRHIALRAAIPDRGGDAIPFGRCLVVRGNHGTDEIDIRQFEREVCRWILRIVREPGAAEDALVEAFWRAYRGRARLTTSVAPSPGCRRSCVLSRRWR
jgi:hypothetical protein